MAIDSTSLAGTWTPEKRRDYAASLGLGDKLQDDELQELEDIEKLFEEEEVSRSPRFGGPQESVQVGRAKLTVPGLTSPRNDQESPRSETSVHSVPEQKVRKIVNEYSPGSLRPRSNDSDVVTPPSLSFADQLRLSEESSDKALAGSSTSETRAQEERMKQMIQELDDHRTREQEEMQKLEQRIVFELQGQQEQQEQQEHERTLWAEQAEQLKQQLQDQSRQHQNLKQQWEQQLKEESTEWCTERSHFKKHLQELEQKQQHLNREKQEIGSREVRLGQELQEERSQREQSQIELKELRRQQEEQEDQASKWLADQRQLRKELEVQQEQQQQQQQLEAQEAMKKTKMSSELGCELQDQKQELLLQVELHHRKQHELEEELSKQSEEAQRMAQQLVEERKMCEQLGGELERERKHREQQETLHQQDVLHLEQEEKEHIWKIESFSWQELQEQRREQQELQQGLQEQQSLRALDVSRWSEEETELKQQLDEMMCQLEEQQEAMLQMQEMHERRDEDEEEMLSHYILEHMEEQEERVRQLHGVQDELELLREEEEKLRAELQDAIDQGRQEQETLEDEAAAKEEHWQRELEMFAAVCQQQEEALKAELTERQQQLEHQQQSALDELEEHARRLRRWREEWHSERCDLRGEIREQTCERLLADKELQQSAKLLAEEKVACHLGTMEEEAAAEQAARLWQELRSQQRILDNGLQQVLEAQQQQALTAHRRLEAEEAMRRELSARRQQDWQQRRNAFEMELQEAIRARRNATAEAVTLENQQLALARHAEESAAERGRLSSELSQLAAVRHQEVAGLEQRFEAREQDLLGERKNWEVQRRAMESEILRLAASQQQAAADAQSCVQKHEEEWQRRLAQREEVWAADWKRLHGVILPLLHEQEAVEAELVSKQLAAEEGIALFKEFAEMQHSHVSKSRQAEEHIAAKLQAVQRDSGCEEVVLELASERRQRQVVEDQSVELQERNRKLEALVQQLRTKTAWEEPAPQVLTDIARAPNQTPCPMREAPSLNPSAAALRSPRRKAAGADTPARSASSPHHNCSARNEVSNSPRKSAAKPAHVWWPAGHATAAATIGRSAAYPGSMSVMSPGRGKATSVLATSSSQAQKPMRKSGVDIRGDPLRQQLGEMRHSAELQKTVIKEAHTTMESSVDISLSNLQARKATAAVKLGADAAAGASSCVAASGHDSGRVEIHEAATAVNVTPEISCPPPVPPRSRQELQSKLLAAYAKKSAGQTESRSSK
eukprot:TRINITY_DN65872_c0_g1_i1.p1 TRINITY_DN65872_c0_g1~~TRINITY_DN65872_c0_g1_i1.p1  ORF type:complete len:1251 (+),score=420.79 TRINITY_DN65872_c0_g1_i1:27-3779(+)